MSVKTGVLAHTGSKGILRWQKIKAKHTDEIKSKSGKDSNLFAFPWNMMRDGEFPGAIV